jgi:LuxR family transcriptional regulator, maltose regulon positive regulatory protein
VAQWHESVSSDGKEAHATMQGSSADTALNATPQLAKISRPRLFNVVARERLFALLDANRGRPLIWIAAPPGSGKTALVASYLEARALAGIWYQVDTGDSDPGSFFVHLSLAAGALPAEESDALPRFLPEHHADIGVFARLYFRALFARLPGDSVLVLDNYQEAGNEAVLHDLLRQAAAEIPPCISILVISRNDAPQGFVQLRASGSLLSLGWSELQLNLDEVRAICAGRQLKDEWLLQALHHQSQGWAAGLTLMLERLGNFSGEAQVLPDDTRESVFHYFAALIFDQAQPRVRETLLSLAFVRSITPRAARELSSDAGAPALLEDLYHRRLFTDRRQGEEPVYQFHALFREFLADRARREFAAESLAALMCRSAEVLEETGDFDAALGLWAAMADWERAIALILREAASLLNSGWRQTVLRWIARIPEEKSKVSPWLLYWQGVAQYQAEPETGLEALQKALQYFRDIEDRPGRMICLASLLSYGMVGCSVIDVLDPWLDELLELSETGTDDLDIDARLRIEGVLCLALYYCRSSHPRTRGMAQRTEALLQLSSNPVAKLEAAMGAMTACAQGGDYERGDRILRETRPCADEPSASPSMAAWWYAQAGYLRFNGGHYEEALELFRAGCRIAERNGLRESIRELIMFCVMVEFRLFGWEVASQTLAQVEAMPPSRRPMAEALLRIYQARKAQSYGMLDRGADLARESHQAVVRTRSQHIEMVFGLFNAESMIVAGRLEEARPLLARSRELIERTEVFSYFAAQPDFVEALAAIVRSDRASAIALTRKSLALARVGSRRFSFRYLECSMPPLFKLALEEDIDPELVQELIRLFRLKPPTDAPDNWPWPVSICTLGSFRLVVDGEPIEFSRKLPRKALLLLKALIAGGGREIPEHTICDLLWGDEDGDAAANALNITLVRLRKLLGKPDAIRHLGGKLSINAEICRVDAWAFEDRLAQGQERKGLDLYAGTFLPEDAGESWTVAMRERLRGKFIHALSSHGATMETAGDFEGAASCYLRGIDADAIVEAFHQGLMRCYRRLGRPMEAISAYRRMKQTLSVVLGVPPSHESQRLYEELVQEQIGAGFGNVEPIVPKLRKAARPKS